jgi:beta-lactamase regulating signal transducer with metallopeptidase domain
LEITMTDAPMKMPWHLWLIGVIAVLFNAIGVFDFVMSMAQGAKYQASAGMTPDQIAHYLGMPGWMTVVWAVGVFGAFLASILLLSTPTSSPTAAPSWASRWRSPVPSSPGCWCFSAGTHG